MNGYTYYCVYSYYVKFTGPNHHGPLKMGWDTYKLRKVLQHSPLTLIMYLYKAQGGVWDGVWLVIIWHSGVYVVAALHVV